MADNFESDHLLDLIFLAQIGIVVANLLTLFVFRSAGYHYDDGYGYTFRGLYTQKNGLGAAFAYGIVFQVTQWNMKREREQGVSLFFWGILLCQVFLLLISKATTAIFCCILPIVYQIYYRTAHRQWRMQWGFVYTIVTVGFLFMAMTIMPLFSSALEAIGKDATLSNRIPMWEKIIAFMQENHTLTGYGLLQFWETPSALKTLHTYYERNSWYRSMSYGAHSVLLEMWLDLGLIGVVAYFITIIYCFRNVGELTNDDYIMASMILIPLLISGLTDRIYTNSNEKTMLFFLMLGVACKGNEKRLQMIRTRMRKRSAQAK